jgi:glycosyltransferase involved in cell wall biosynthesis
LSQTSEFDQLKRRMAALARRPSKSSGEQEVLDMIRAAGRLFTLFARKADAPMLAREQCRVSEVPQGGQRRPLAEGVLQALATFADCQTWVSHKGGKLTYVFFGLEGHTEIAARILLEIHRLVSEDEKTLQSSPLRPAPNRKAVVELRKLVTRISSALKLAVREREAELALESRAEDNHPTSIRSVVDEALRAFRPTSPSPRLKSAKPKNNLGKVLPAASSPRVETTQATIPVSDQPSNRLVHIKDASNVRGLVEGLIGNRLLGWAYDPSTGRPCTVLVVDGSGTVVSVTSARLQRSDLAALGFGRDDFAFRAEIRLQADSQDLRVYADGMEIAGSPLPIGPGIFDGIANAADGAVEGWVYERRSESVPPVITLLDQDDICVGRATAVADADPSAPARFKVALFANAYGRARLALRVAANGTVFQKIQTSLPMVWSLDELNETHCRGWMLCNGIIEFPYQIEVWEAGVRVGSGKVDVSRRDLLDSFPGHPAAGFDFELKPRNVPGRMGRRLSFRLQGSHAELFGGPFVTSTGARKIDATLALARLLQTRPELDSLQTVVLRDALLDYRRKIIASDERPSFIGVGDTRWEKRSRRINVLIFLRGDKEMLRGCIDSVLAYRNSETDSVALVFPAASVTAFDELMREYSKRPNLYLISGSHIEDLASIDLNALSFFETGDVIVLSPSVRVFPGVLDELASIGSSASDIGLVSAMSNVAPGLSYPAAGAKHEHPVGLDWDQVSAAALLNNRGKAIDTPRTNSICLLLTRSVLNHIAPGRGSFYNELPSVPELRARILDLGFRSVVATGAFVRESFVPPEHPKLTGSLQAVLEASRRSADVVKAVPFKPTADDLLLRTAGWGIDMLRLTRAVEQGQKYTLVITNSLGGGTAKRVEEMEAGGAHGDELVLTLTADNDGLMKLSSESLATSTYFLHGDENPLFSFLQKLPIASVHIHQLLCFHTSLIKEMKAWLSGRRSVYYLHDYYPACPRVTMIDATNSFCGAAATDVCERCIALGGVHHDARTDDLMAAEHRALFADLLSSMTEIVAPSKSSALYLRRVFPDLQVSVRSHEDRKIRIGRATPFSSLSNVVLLGAINPHKGSRLLLELAGMATIWASHLRFHVIGYTDVDEKLRALGNVSITGEYNRNDLPQLVAAAAARYALFLHHWPETYSYTLTEAMDLGLTPLVPDIGAPADRVRTAGLGKVFGFPIDLMVVLKLLVGNKSPKPIDDPGPLSKRLRHSPVQSSI